VMNRTARTFDYAKDREQARVAVAPCRIESGFARGVVLLRTAAALIVLTLILCCPRDASAQTDTCDALRGDKRALADQLLDSQHPYDCCDGTLRACLQQKPVCRLAKRLANDVCRRVASGQSRADIERALARRAVSMTSARVAAIDTTQMDPAGAADAKVQVVAYVCARCPYCSQLVPRLHQSVTEGALKGIARLHVRIFPIRTHEGSTDGGLAIVAAQKLGKLWPFLLHLYRNFDRFDPARLPDCASAQGMDRDAFIRMMNDAATRQSLVASKREGVRNKVDATPTVFLNGRIYTGDLDTTSLQDVIEEENDRLARRIHDQR